MKERIVIINPVYKDLSLEHEILAPSNYELVVANVHSPNELVSMMSDAVALMTVDVPINGELVSQLSHCRVVSRMGVGFDCIDVKGCRQHNVEVCYVPDYGTEDVANHAIALLFSAHRRLLTYHRSITNGIWDYKVGGQLHNLNELKLGVIGLGRIGSNFAKKMKIFVKDIYGYDPFISNEKIREQNIHPSSTDEIFSECDIISLHIPLTEKNYHFISSATIAKMKRQPIFINVSRGGLVDTTALIVGLKTGQISYACLDVLEDESNINQELIKLENVLLTPHAAWYSIEAEKQLRTKAITDVLRVLNGQKPVYPVPNE